MKTRKSVIQVSGIIANRSAIAAGLHRHCSVASLSGLSLALTLPLR
jgi:hypothetical protein